APLQLADVCWVGAAGVEPVVYLPCGIPGCAGERLDVWRCQQEDGEVRALDFPDRLSHGFANGSGGKRSLVEGLRCTEDAPEVVEAEHEVEVGRAAAVLPGPPGVEPVFQRDAPPAGNEGRRGSDRCCPG